jgi:hypothetical protein
MEHTPAHSLATALSHVFQALGQDVPAHQLEPVVTAGMEWGDIPGLDDLETGQYGTYPYNSPSIARFEDGSYHYVDSPADRTILDSTDGTSKRMEVYGTPNAWATFQYNPDKPLPKPEPMVYVTNTITGIRYDILKPKAPTKMYVNKPEGIDLMDFSGQITTPREFMGIPDTHLPYASEVRIMGTASYPINGYPNEDFYIPQEPHNVWGEFTRTGKPAALQGYKCSDLSDTVPPALTSPKPTPVSSPKPALNSPKLESVITAQPMTDIQPQAKPDTRYFNFSYLRPDQQPVKYKLHHRIIIKDYSQQGPDVELTKANHPTLGIYGSFRPITGKTYLLLCRKGDQLFDYWYGIPEVLDGRRIVEELPDYTDIAQAAQTTVPERLAIGRPRPSDHIVNFATITEELFKQNIRKIIKWK